MSGRLTPQGSARRASLLDAAEAVLVAQGNREASLRAIAAEAGVRIGHLQHYFPTRADLVKAMLERALDRSLQRLEEVTGLRVSSDHPTAIHVPDALRDATDLVTAVLADQDDPHLVRLYVEVWGMAAREPEIASVVREFYGRYVGHVEAFVRHRRPGWAPEVCRARAETFVALVEGAALMRTGVTGHRSPETDRELVRCAAALLEG